MISADLCARRPHVLQQVGYPAGPEGPGRRLARLRQVPHIPRAQGRRRAGIAIDMHSCCLSTRSRQAARDAHTIESVLHFVLYSMYSIT